MSSMERIGLIGTGKLGLCMGLLFERAGYHVTGVDVNNDYVTALNNKVFSSEEKGVNEALQQASNFYATTDIQEVLQDDVTTLLVIVPTTSPSEMIYTYTAAEKVIKKLEAYGARTKSVQFVMVSTTPPGYCQRIADRLRPLNYRVLYHPEFIAQGTIMENLCKPDILLIGREEENNITAVESTLQAICKHKPRVHSMSLLSAEITKLSLNCFLTMKIAFANAIGDLALHVGAEHTKVLKAIADDKRIGSRYISYGFGYGGACLPRDNQALNSYAMQVGTSLHLSSATQTSNEAHLFFQKALYLEKYAPEETIVFEGVTYKAGTGLIEKSQPLALARMLAEEGRRVLIKDSATVINKVKVEFPDLFVFEEVETPSRSEE